MESWPAFPVLAHMAAELRGEWPNQLMQPTVTPPVVQFITLSSRWCGVTAADRER